MLSNVFKALQHLTCQDVEYAPGEIIPGATSFPNLKEMIEWRYIGYATEQEIADYQTEKMEIETQKQAEEAAKQAEEAAQKQAEEAAKTKNSSK